MNVCNGIRSQRVLKNKKKNSVNAWLCVMCFNTIVCL
jgi:hypothetical protein